MGLKQWFANSALVSGIREATSHELFAGVEKPSVTLAKIFVAEMLQNINVRERMTDMYQREYTFPSFSLELRTSLAEPRVWSIRLTSGGIAPFGTQEQDIILEGWKKWKILNDKWVANKAENARQEKAVELIATMLKV